MPTVHLSPILNNTQFDDNGVMLNGGKIYTYIAGTTTALSTYTTSAGTVAQTNPIILNSRGEVDDLIWLAAGSTYKFVLKDSTDTLIRTMDNIVGVGDTSVPTFSEWVLSASTATYIGGTSFSVPGDQTATLTVQRRIKATVSGGEYYGTITTAVFAAGVTTCTMVNDSIALDAGLSAFYYGFMDPQHGSLSLALGTGLVQTFADPADIPLPGNGRIKLGTATSAGTTGTVSFAPAFTGGCLGAFPVDIEGTPAAIRSFGVSSYTAAGFSWAASSAPGTFSWIAVGYDA